MVWHLIKPLIGELSKPFRDASLELLKVEKGVETGAPPWKSCVTKTNSVMGFATGYLYIKERSGKNAKKQVENRFNFLTFRFVCVTSENFVLTNKVFFFPSSAIFTHLERRAILNLVSKLTRDCIDSSLLLLVITSVFFRNTQSKGDSSSRRRGIVNSVHRFKQL